jgi:ribosome-binding protein aMBF1 (putative translation factor)
MEKENNNLKTLIRKAGTNYREVAQKLGTSSSHVTSWNKGRAVPGLKIAVKLAKLLDVTLEELADSLGYLDDED